MYRKYVSYTFAYCVDVELIDVRIYISYTFCQLEHMCSNMFPIHILPILFTNCASDVLH